MVGNLEENQRRKATFIPILTLIICVSGLMAISYTLMITDVTNEFDIITEDDVRLSLVDSEMNVIEKGGFARMANNGKGASKIFYTSSCVNGDPEQLSYHIWKQSLEFGSANLNIGVPDNTVKYVKVWYELNWSADTRNFLSPSWHCCFALSQWSEQAMLSWQAPLQAQETHWMVM
jgi:hypothetical protein